MDLKIWTAREKVTICNFFPSGPNFSLYQDLDSSQKMINTTLRHFCERFTNTTPEMHPNFQYFIRSCLASPKCSDGIDQKPPKTIDRAQSLRESLGLTASLCFTHDPQSQNARTSSKTTFVLTTWYSLFITSRRKPRQNFR